MNRATNRALSKRPTSTIPTLPFQSPLTPGTLLRRYKRFLSDVRLENGKTVVAHVPNTGAMTGLADPGSPVALSHQPSPKRKLPWTLELVWSTGCWVGVNTGRSNRIVEVALQAGRFASLRGYERIRREAALGNGSRLDFLLEGARGRCLVEVKNATLRQGRRALFPDAVTLRGARHLEDLLESVGRGNRGVILFLVNRSDCTSMAPADLVDPEYGRTLRRVADAGVEVLAYRVRNTMEGSRVERKVPVVL